DLSRASAGGSVQSTARQTCGSSEAFGSAFSGQAALVAPGSAWGLGGSAPLLNRLWEGAGAPGGWSPASPQLQ
ncbi:unnamed protein product, partial [Polarella glacialis]